MICKKDEEKNPRFLIQHSFEKKLNKNNSKLIIKFN